MLLTISKLAKMARISVRTLHHYDAIGLLRPFEVGQNGYRKYGPSEAARLAEILMLRAMDVPLADIGAMLAMPAAKRLNALRTHRAALAEKWATMGDNLRALDQIITNLENPDMAGQDTYLFPHSPEKQAEYEAYLLDKYGPQMQARIDASHAHMRAKGADGQAAHMQVLAEIEADVIGAMQAGIAANAAALDPIVARHCAWVAESWGRSCPPSAYIGLAEIYQTDDFRARYEGMAVGLTDYLCGAMRAWGQRQLAG